MFSVHCNSPFKSRINQNRFAKNKFSIRKLEKDDWKKIWKNNVTIALNIVYAKKGKIYILLIFQNITQIMKISYSFDDCKWKGIILSSRKKLSALLRGITLRCFLLSELGSLL